METKYLYAFLALFFPRSHLLPDYKRINDVAFNVDSSLVINSLIENYNILIDRDSFITINPTYAEEVANAFDSLSEFHNNYVVDKLFRAVNNIFNCTPFKDLISIYCEALFIQDDEIHNKNILSKLKQCVIKLTTNDAVLPDRFERLIALFESKYICDTLKIDLIHTLYKINKNRIAVQLYETIKNTDVLNAESLLQISSAYFMLTQTDSAQDLLIKIKNKFADYPEIQNAIRVVEIIYAHETTDHQDRQKIVTDFWSMVDMAQYSPNCTGLLLKIAASVLSHDEAIKFITQGNLSDRTLQIYSNLGALYLAEGHRRYVKNVKDTEYLVKARKYFDFTKLLVEEKDEYVPYLNLNLMSMKLNIEYRKRSLKKKYNQIYKGFKSLENKADSLYFRSIVLCNCLVLERLTSNNSCIINNYKEKLELIREQSQDRTIDRKINEFYNFIDAKSQFLPVWVITETHY